MAGVATISGPGIKFSYTSLMKWEWSHLPFSLEDVIEQSGMDPLSLLRQHWVPAFPEPLPSISIISPDNLPPRICSDPNPTPQASALYFAEAIGKGCSSSAKRAEGAWSWSRLHYLFS